MSSGPFSRVLQEQDRGHSKPRGDRKPPAEVLHGFLPMVTAPGKTCAASHSARQPAPLTSKAMPQTLLELRPRLMLMAEKSVVMNAVHLCRAGKYDHQ